MHLKVIQFLKSVICNENQFKESTRFSERNIIKYWRLLSSFSSAENLVYLF
jgi:hypothetical protein